MEDYILNGKACGSVAQRLLAFNGDPLALRPYFNEEGKECISRRIGKEIVEMPVANANTTLTKEAWLLFDEQIMRAAKPRLKAVADLLGANLTYNLPNGMAHTALQYQRMTDIDDATISMDGLRQGPNDRPEFDLVNLPLPLIHKDFRYPLREIMASRNGSAPLDTTHGMLAGEKVAEMAEKLLIGTAGSYGSVGGGYVYGYTNFPSRITRTITSPTDSAWTPATLLSEVLAMRQDATDAYHYGPFVLYFGTAWDQYLDGNFSTQYPEPTVRNRLRMIENISDVRTLDYLTGYSILLVEQNTGVVRMVVGFNVTTVQWEINGGMEVCFKVLALLVPQIRADINDNTGIVHGSTS